MREIIEVKTLKNYRLRLIFQNNEIKIFDLKPYFLKHSVFNILQDENIFKNVQNKKYFVEWPNEIDLSADTLYLDSIVE